MEFNNSFSDAGSEREFSIALKKCDTARHSGDAASPKVYSPVKQRPMTALETPEKLNFGGVEEYESFSPTKAEKEMDPDELSPVKQAKPGTDKRWTQFDQIEVFDPLNTSLSVEQ